MKKILIAVLLVSSACLAQHPALDLYGKRLIEGRPFLTFEDIYDSYDLFNSPLGVFEIDSSSLSIEAGYSLFSLDNNKRHYFSIPVLRMGEPRRAYFQVFYGPDLLSYDTPDESMSLPLHRFGLTLAAQSQSGLFQASIMSSGYIGTQSFKNSSDSRALAGLEDLRFDFGSQPHPMARVGVFIGAALNIDTLKNSETLECEDRSAHVVLPSFGGFVDFNGHNLPVRSHLSLQYSSGRFVYVSKDEKINSYGVDGLGNEYSIKNDSLQFIWMTAGRIPVKEHFIKPGLLLGFSANAGKLHWPDEDSDPFKMKDAVEGGSFDLTEVYFGIGAGFEAFSYADMFIEYVHNSASLNYGEHFHNPPNAPTSRGLHSFALGASTPLHKYLAVPFSLSPRIAYFISQSAGAVEARHINTKPLNPVRSRSKAAIYEPQLYLENKETASGFTLGLDAQSSDTKFGGSFYTTFLNKNPRGRSGIEMEFIFAFAIPGPSSGLFE
ncbi:MAG: hypothetical protein LBB56_01375 [Chitinispirillales bacterium]|jgi:hypothetical protein|nr:hypothetical protein [Chitinispirillales bacterium]